MSAWMFRHAHIGFQARQIPSWQELRIMFRVLKVRLIGCAPRYVRIDCSGAWYKLVCLGRPRNVTAILRMSGILQMA